MAVNQTFNAPGQSNTLQTTSVGYFAVFTGATGSAQFEVLIGEDWLPVGAPITATPASVLFTGRDTGGSQEPLIWRWNITALSAGTIEVYMG